MARAKAEYEEAIRLMTKAKEELERRVKELEAAQTAQEDATRARERYHLTAAQAGELARRAGARELRIFHFSPKYKGREDELVAEAAEAFGGPVAVGP